MSRIVLLCVALALPLVRCCEKSSFKDVKVEASRYFLKNESEDVTLTGCITPTSEFKNAVSIVIKKQNIPTLHQDSVSDLPWLHELTMEDNNIENVEAGAFRSLPTLVSVNLANNKIKTIVEGVFNSMNIKRLILNNNRISDIAPSAFDNMPELNKIDLDHNDVQKWNSNWFTNSPNVRLLSFTHNQIGELPANAFKNLKHDAKPTIFLSNNKIATIDKDAFKGLSDMQFLDLDKNQIVDVQDVFSNVDTITTLLLSGNKIKCLSENVLNSLPKTELTNLENNPLNCDCLKKMQEWNQKHTANLKMYIRKIECMQERIRDTLSKVKNREY